MFHRTRDAIEAHLTVVVASLAISRELYARSGIPTPKLIKRLRRLTTSIVSVKNQILEFPPELTNDDQKFLNTLNSEKTTKP